VTARLGFVLDPGIREVVMTVVVRQVVFPNPACNLLRIPVRSSVAVLPPAIALVQEPLVVALQLVVQDHAIDSAALLAEALLAAQVGAIDLRVVRQLARLSEAGVEALTGLPRAFLGLARIRFEHVTATVGQDDSTVVRTERRGVQQTLSLKVALGAECALTAVVKITLGHDSKGADSGEHPAFRSVHLVHTIAFSHRPALTSARQVESSREHISWVSIVRRLTVAARTAMATTVSIAGVGSISEILESRIVRVPHATISPYGATPRNRR
jgi:hypothetical protein